MKELNRTIGQWAVASALAVSLFATAFAGIEDKVLRFSTPGVDRYADGSVVADGECYALVWSPAGKSFSGFNADGTPVSSRDYVVLAAPLAKGGRCRDVIFQIPAAEFAALEGGEWTVCLVDTRNQYGVPAGVQDGLPLRVNRWGAVNGGVKLEPSDASDAMAASPRLAAGGTRFAASAASTAGGGTVQPVRANILSAVPPNLAPPRITDIEVADGEVWLAVDGTVPYLNYTIVSGETPDNLKTDYFSEVVEGDGDSEIAIGTVRSAKRRFFKVKRAE